MPLLRMCSAFRGCLLFHYPNFSLAFPFYVFGIFWFTISSPLVFHCSFFLNIRITSTVIFLFSFPQALPPTQLSRSLYESLQPCDVHYPSEKLNLSSLDLVLVDISFMLINGWFSMWYTLTVDSIISFSCTCNFPFYWICTPKYLFQLHTFCLYICLTSFLYCHNSCFI